MSFSGCPDEVWILTSPKAGRGDGGGHVRRLAALLSARGIQVKRTDRLEDLSKRAADADAGNRWLVVTAGGDGTLAIAASRVGCDVPLVPFPLGTENLLALHYGHSADPEAALATVTGGTDRPMDAGLATKLDGDGKPLGKSKLFLVMATAGFDAEVVRCVHLRRRGHVSRWTYAWPILRTMSGYRFPPIQVRVDGCPSGDAANTDVESRPESAWAMAFNLPCYAASLPIAPPTVDDDGQLDLLNLQRRTLWAGMGYFASIVRRRLLRRSDVHVARAPGVDWTSQGRVPFQLDGDYAGHLPVRLETLPRRVCLRMPARSPT